MSERDWKRVGKAILRSALGIPIVLCLSFLCTVLGHPDALEAAGNLLSIWILAGSAAPCADILRLAEDRGKVKVGVWFDREDIQ
jgi:hypothetical protein